MTSTLSNLLSLGPNLSRQKSKSHEEISSDANQSSTLAAPKGAAASIPHSASVQDNLEGMDKGREDEKSPTSTAAALSPLAKITRGIQVSAMRVFSKASFIQLFSFQNFGASLGPNSTAGAAKKNLNAELSDPQDASEIVSTGEQDYMATKLKEVDTKTKVILQLCQP